MSTSPLHCLVCLVCWPGAYPHNLECCSAGDVTGEGGYRTTEIQRYRECDDVMVRWLLTLLCCVV